MTDYDLICRLSVHLILSFLCDNFISVAEYTVVSKQGECCIYANLSR